MATRLLQFPVRNTFAPIRSHDSLARDTQYQASRIAEQVEQEMARKAQRMSVGLRIEFADARSRRPANVIMMPGSVRKHRTQATLLDKTLAAASNAMTSLFKSLRLR